MIDPVRASVSATARRLGFAGLLPPLAAVVLQAIAVSQGLFDTQVLMMLVVLAYASVILSFLGGIWWGFAMRRGGIGGAGGGQGVLAAAAVVPSLIAVPLLWLGLAWGPAWPWAWVALGSAILLTLPVDRHLVATGDAPVGWMALRVPLSIGLGALTILSGVLSPS